MGLRAAEAMVEDRGIVEKLRRAMATLVGVDAIEPDKTVAARAQRPSLRMSDRACELMKLALSCIEKPASGPTIALLDAIEAVPHRELPILDECVRAALMGPAGWHQLDHRRFAHAARPWAAAAVAASHASGYVREAAVRVLAAAQDARVLPFILLRLNDWVVEVRRAARVALSNYVKPEFAPALMGVLPMIQSIRGKQRCQHEAVIGSVTTLLAAPELFDVRLAGCRSEDLDTRRGACFDFSLEMVPPDAPTLLDVALGDREPGIRAWPYVARASCSLPPGLACWWTDPCATVVLRSAASRSGCWPIRYRQRKSSSLAKPRSSTRRPVCGGKPGSRASKPARSTSPGSIGRGWLTQWRRGRSARPCWDSASRVGSTTFHWCGRT